MPKLVKRLTAKSVESKKKPGYYLDGEGLYLQVSRGGSKSWVLRYRKDDRAREMGLGSARSVSLEAAREKAAAQRRILVNGDDPIQTRIDVKIEKRLIEARKVTFDYCAARYIKTHRASWKNAKHASQWVNTLRTYVTPVFGALPVQDIDQALVVRVLEPIWESKTETASRVRNRIELVLDWAKASGYREGDNPARWRHHLDKVFPKRSKVAPARNHPALPYVDAPAFLAELRARQGVAPKALEFVILTAVRVSEAVNATWAEVDLKSSLWTIPAARMKSKRQHRVPLSSAAMEVLTAMKELKGGADFVFPGWIIKRPLTDAACLKVLRDMERRDLTVHGFRSTFRDWCAERTAYPSEVCEMALAHALKDKTEAAYRRGDLLEKRAKLMEEWAQYLAKPLTANVTPIRKRKTN